MRKTFRDEVAGWVWAEEKEITWRSLRGAEYAQKKMARVFAREDTEGTK